MSKSTFEIADAQAFMVIAIKVSTSHAVNTCDVSVAHAVNTCDVSVAHQCPKILLLQNAFVHIESYRCYELR
jgi:hypothetical protein